MYLVVIHVPIYKDGEELFLATDWRRSVLLLRDSLRGKLGNVTILAPSLPLSAARNQAVEPLGPDGEDVTLVPSFDARCRARSYWLRERRRWRADIARLLPRARAVHAGLDDVYRPISYAGHLAAVRAGVPTIFVQDVDIVYRCKQVAQGAGPAGKLKMAAYARIYERLCRHGVATASVSLLKGRAIMRRYGEHARNPRMIHDTSYSAADIVDEGAVEARLARRAAAPGLRLVFCGRLVKCKGLPVSIDLVAAARRLGADVTFDIIGAGTERGALESQVERLGLGSAVRFLGHRRYGSELIAELSGYDALLFTPESEETPRMIFDGYAAGLPLIGIDIPYVRERHDEERACFLLRADEPEAWPHLLAKLASEPARLAEPTRAAIAAARYHACESWYARRAEWTFDALGIPVEGRRLTLEVAPEEVVPAAKDGSLTTPR